MTSETAHDVTDDDRRLAREWASNVRRHADKHFPAERAIARVILNAVPTPPRPTLADMTPKERVACQWMQADTKLWGRVVIIVPDLSDGRAALLDRSGDVIYGRYVNATPRPDLPRLEWPGDQKPAPTLPEGWRLADHREYGRVIVTNPTPNRDGYVYVVLPVDDPMGYDWHFCDPDDLTYIDAEPGGDTPDAVPESTLAVGSEWHDADALAQACEESGRDQIVVTEKSGYVFVWDDVAGRWKGHAMPRFAPYTIIHAGKKADQ